MKIIQKTYVDSINTSNKYVDFLYFFRHINGKCRFNRHDNEDMSIFIHFFDIIKITTKFTLVFLFAKKTRRDHKQLKNNYFLFAK